MPAATVTMHRDLPARATSAGEARALVRDALERGGAQEWIDPAQLALSEVVTNALVHVGRAFGVRVRLDDAGLRVEVADDSPHLPVARHYAPTSGTGRGLRLLEELVDDWGSTAHAGGKVVWFEIRTRAGSPEQNHLPARTDRATGTDRAAGADGDAAREFVRIELLRFPMLMHAAWQEHAEALLREFLLVSLDDDQVTGFERHAQASDALNLLGEQAPAPSLGEDPDAIMAHAVEPDVTATQLTLQVPVGSLRHFATLEEMLAEAVEMASVGDLLVPPTQPEVGDLSRWLCGQVRDQATGTGTAVPWSSEHDTSRIADVVLAPGWDPTEISGSAVALLATDEASLIVAASPSALRFLGYARQDDLVGRPIIRIVPHRYHQAHIAGTTLHMANGRSPLLGVAVTVPVVRADGTEAPVTLRVVSRGLPHGRRIFVAEFLLDRS
jgi:PAS domain S-box-containing protein